MSQHFNLWKHAFPELVTKPDAVLQQLIDSAQLLTLPIDQPAFHAGDRCSSYLLVVTGSIRVQLTTESGRDVVLYRVQEGDTCVITTSCLLGAKSYPADAYTESPVTVFAIDNNMFNKALNESQQFRQFVFAKLGQRFADVITRIEEVTSSSIEKRLAQTLLALTKQAPVIQTTHQALAAELGTAREVISRQLKRFSQQNWVQLDRGTVTVLAPEQLAQLTKS